MNDDGDDRHFGLVDPFDVDNGELDGLTPAMVFTLGVEWEMIRKQVDDGEPFSALIHSENRNRLESLLTRRNRRATFTFMANDVSESWMLMNVETKS